MIKRHSAHKLVEKHPELLHLSSQKVMSHVQREAGDWYLNTLMLEGLSVPFKYKRKQPYRNLRGARVNVTYYPINEEVAGISFEAMKVVRLRVS